MKTNEKILTKKDVSKIWWRVWLHGQDGWCYERYMGLGYTYSVLPALRKIYKDDKEGLRLAVKNHLQFFNCGIYTSPLIMGSTIAIEEEKKQEGQETVTAIKTGLMGPLAGVHDALFQTTFKTIFGAIAAYMALEGSFIGVWIWIAANIGKLVMSYQFMHLGYHQGINLVTKMGEQLKKITECANILGMVVIGTLIPSVVKATVPFVYENGDVTLEIQSILDTIMPSLLPALFVAVVYWLLGKKGVTAIKMILVLVVVSIVCSALGILG